MFLALEGGFFDVCDIMPSRSLAAERFEFCKLCGDLSKNPAVLVLLLFAVLLVLFVPNYETYPSFCFTFMFIGVLLLLTRPERAK